MLQLLRQLLLLLIVKPITGLLIGVDVIGKNKLPLKGPALIAANHNSHVDTLILLSLFPASKLKYVRPVAAIRRSRSASPPPPQLPPQPDQRP